MKKLSFLLLWLVKSALAQNLQPTDELALLKGIVTNFAGKPLSGETILFVNDKTKATVKINTDETGRFEALVPVNATYSLKYKNFTTDMDYTKMQVPGDKRAQYSVAIKIDPPREFILDNVYFDVGKASLKPSSYKALNDLVEILKIKSEMAVEIQGHTDNVGRDEDNFKLSQERAAAVRQYLLAKGISAERVSAKGYGPSQPIADNSTEEGKAKNRRTSLKVIAE